MYKLVALSVISVIPVLLLVPAVYGKDRPESFEGDEFGFLASMDCPVPVNELQIMKSKILEHVSESYYNEHFDLDIVRPMTSPAGCKSEPWQWLLIEAHYEYTIEGYSFPYTVTMEWDKEGNTWEFTHFIAPREVTSVIGTDLIEKEVRECMEIEEDTYLVYEGQSRIAIGFTLLNHAYAHADVKIGETLSKNFSINLENGTVVQCGEYTIAVDSSTNEPITISPVACFSGGLCPYSIGLDKGRKSLFLDYGRVYNADASTTLTIPRMLIDAKANGIDRIFIVMIDGNRVPYVETDKTETHRTLVIQVPVDARRIDIFGTQVMHVNNKGVSIAFDKPWYKMNDLAILTVIDPSINPKNDPTLSNIDTIEARVWTSLDKGGTYLHVLRETSPTSGIFQEIITWDTNLESGRLLHVEEEGGTISASYNDLITSAKIVAIGPLTFGGLIMAEDRMIGRTIAIGADTRIDGYVYNKSKDPLGLVCIVQIKNSEGFTEEIFIRQGRAVGKDSSLISFAWEPVALGDYQFRIFLWSDLNKPTVLGDYTTSDVTFVQIDANGAVELAMREDNWSERALNGVNIRTEFYFLKANGDLYSSDLYSRQPGSFIGRTVSPVDGKDHLVWRVSMWTKLSGMGAFWSYFVDDIGGSVVAKECIEISCDEVAQLIEDYNEFPVAYSYYSESRIIITGGIHSIASKLENSTVSARLEAEPYCWESNLYNYAISASLFNKEPPYNEDAYNLGFSYSKTSGLTNVTIINPVDKDGFLNQWLKSKILRYTGIVVTEFDFKQSNWETHNYSFRGEPNWSLIKKDMQTLLNSRLSGSCVWEEYSLGHIQYAVPYVVLEQNIIENNLKVAKVRVLLTESGFMSIYILSEKEIDPGKTPVSLFTKAGLPLIYLETMKFESQSAQPAG